MRFHVFDRSHQGVVRDEGVGIEQQSVFALQVLDQLVVGAAETDVLRIGHQQRLGADRRQALQESSTEALSTTK